MYALIVEPQLRRAARYVEAVEGEGLDPALARNEEEAREILATRGSPAVCVLELTGAGVGGFRLLADAKAAGLRLPAVVVSAFGALRDTAWRQREALGISVVLSTELAPEAIRNAVRVALGRAARPRRAPDTAPDGHVEALRLDRLDASGLATAPDTPAALDALIADLPSTFGVDAAVCSVLLADRELIVAQSGLSGRVLVERGTRRENSIGRHVVEAVGGEALVIEDASRHPTFAENLLVREGVVRGFVGVPLLSSSGVPLGALCLLDGNPLTATEATLTALRLVAQRLSGEIELLPAVPEPVEEDEAALALGYLKVLIQNLEQPVLAWGASGTVRVANAALTRALGIPAARILGCTRPQFAELVAPVIPDVEFLDILRTIPAGAVVAVRDVEVATEPPRVFRWRTKPVDLPGGRGQLDLWTDVTAERALIRAALTDGLTNLANRRGGEHATRRELARAERESRPLSFLLLDIDHFKRVNDTYGHSAGDTVIRGVAHVLSRTLRASDVPVRWGGEEFLVVLPDTDLALAERVGDRVRVAIQEADFGGGPRVTVSVGAAQREPGEAAEAAIGRADAALYEAKEGGRNRVVADRGSR